MLINITQIKRCCLCLGLCTPIVHALEWQAQASVGMLQHSYYEKEKEGLTKDGVLNRELGNMPMASFSMMTQAKNSKHWLPFAQLVVGYADGTTNYDGYLQSGTQLTPYQTDTKNQIWLSNLTLGLKKDVSKNITFSPQIKIAHNHWQRALEQYTEKLEHIALLSGINIDWQIQHLLNTKKSMWLTIAANYGKHLYTQINVDDLAFKQNMGKAGIWQFSIQTNYSLMNKLNLAIGISHQKWRYKYSKVMNGFRYPDSETKQILWNFGLVYHF